MRPKNWPATPALAFTVTISTIRLRPALVGERPITLCRYIGRKILRPMIEPQPKQFIAMAQRATGSLRIESGMSGAGGGSRRVPKVGAAAHRDAPRGRGGG